MTNSSRLDPRYVSLILDSVSQGIFTVDSKGRITTFNSAACEITGYSEEEVLGRPCREVFKSDLCDSICPMRQSIDSRKEVRGREIRIKSKDGRSIPISITTTPLQTKNGNLLGGVEVFRDLSQLNALRRKLDNKYQFEDIISKNPEMQRIFRLLPLVADSDSTILITGESGTGKELIAKAVHNAGGRANHPFIPVNCAALPETLLESELFGYKKGAFTDARQDKPGRIAMAEGGTLFLDEVADLSRTLQVKLLRFLQEHTYEPLGENKPISTDVRVVTATNRDLRVMVREGTFREDLYFRLNVMEIHLPPLRKRTEDIPLLVQHFIADYQTSSRKSIHGITEEALASLMRYPFPGNIRELENIVERAFILCTGPEITQDNLPDYIHEHQEDHPSASGPQLDKLKHAERDAIIEALKKHGGNRTHAARELGVHRVTLVRKLRKYGIS